MAGESPGSGEGSGEGARGGGRAAAPIRVLHVDDDESYVELSARLLERENDRLTVLTATSGAAGLSLFEDERIDCVVSDYEMPDMDGLTLLDRLRERDPDLPFILLTGRGDEGVASEAVRREVTDYVRKRASTEQHAVVADRVVRAVARRRARISYREIFEKAAVGIILHDPDGSINDANPAMAELLGYDRETLLSMDVGEFSAGTGPYTQAEAEKHVRRAVEGEPQRFEWLDETKEGEPLWVDVTLQHTRIDGRDQVLATIRDIDERKQREQRLERQNERLEEFASIVSHDLRNPLNVAQGYLQHVAEECESEAITPLRGALDRMRTITDDSLTLARQGGSVTDPEPVPLHERAREWWSVVETADADLVIEKELVVRADPPRLRSVFENLFRNAVEHAGDDATVKLGPLPDGFHVSDDGPGFPTVQSDGGVDAPEGDAALGIRGGDESDSGGDSVFEVGYTTGTDGNGLGLAIVRRIAEAHGWSVRATASPSGGGRVEFHGVERA